MPLRTDLVSADSVHQGHLTDDGQETQLGKIGCWASLDRDILRTELVVARMEKSISKVEKKQNAHWKDDDVGWEKWSAAATTISEQRVYRSEQDYSDFF